MSKGKHKGCKGERGGNGNKAFSAKHLLCGKQPPGQKTHSSGKQQRQENEFDRQHAALVSRSMKKKVEPISITIHASRLAGVGVTKHPILPDVLLEGECSNDVLGRGRKAALKESSSTVANIFSALEDEGKAAVTLNVRPSALSALLRAPAPIADDDL